MNYAITQLTDLLSGAFGSANTIDQYHGELNTSYIRKMNTFWIMEYSWIISAG